MKKIFIFGLLILMSISMVSCFSCSSLEETNTPEDRKRRAAVISETFIKTRLKHPNEADFSLNYTVVEQAGHVYLVNMPLTTKNSFGVKVSLTAKLKMKWNEKNWADSRNWTLQSIEVK